MFLHLSMLNFSNLYQPQIALGLTPFSKTVSDFFSLVLGLQRYKPFFNLQTLFFNILKPAFQFNNRIFVTSFAGCKGNNLC
jgi:hypothetical protein